MNTSNEQLKISAERGNIDLLYAVIQHDPSILEYIDKIQFVETPLHISASKGHLEFASEIMNLKPSFAKKLNTQGFSPIHLAMDSLRLAMDNPTHHDVANNLREMVSKLVGINKDLVRVKGREGLTPLHFASQYGEVELLAEFLTACPDSIEDVTVRGESALHIAVLNHQFEVLQVLVGWLETNYKREARMLENKILNLKDKTGNTVLHLSALSSEPQVLQFLVKTGTNLNAKNLENKTALDLARTPELRKILRCAGAKIGSEVTNAPTSLAEKLRSKPKMIDNILTWILRIRRDLSEEQRNTWLIVATLVATATYQSALSPPGGVYQASATDGRFVTSRNSTIFIPGNVGKSVMSSDLFFQFSFMNMISFSISIAAIFILTPRVRVGHLVFVPVLWFLFSYLISMEVISPTYANSVPVMFAIVSIGFVVCICSALVIYFELQQAKKLRRS